MEGGTQADPGIRVLDAADAWDLGDYEIIGELGRGGMGLVYLARRSGQAGFARLFAIKLLLEDMVDDAEAAVMLLDEAHIASRIHHPNVVPITDIGEYDEGHYLVMDYVEGCSLLELLQRQPTERPARILVPIMLDALRGLHAAHSLTEPDGSPSNLVHRDFSPQNILVDVDGTCRVIDFGIAKVAARLAVTAGNFNKGKMAYMSPEQLAAARNIDRRADIWAAGVVLYYALTGVHPIRDKNDAKTISNILHKEILPPSTVGLKPPECLDELCLKSLQRAREDRYATTMEMADAIHQTAVKNDLLGSPSEVADWVAESFEKELTGRREAIRARTEGSGSSRVRRKKRPDSISISRGAKVLDAVDIDVGDDPDELEPPAPDPPTTSGEESEEMVLEEGDLEIHDGPPPPPLPLGATPRRTGRWRLLAGGAGALLGAAVIIAVVALRGGGGDSDLPEGDEIHAAVGGGAASAPDGGVDAGAPTIDEPDVDAAVEGADAAFEGADGRAEEASAEVDGSVTDEPPGEVTVTVTGVPETATMRLDGNPVQGPEVAVAVDGNEHVLRVDAPGFRQWSRTMTPTADTSVEVELRERRSRRRRPPSVVRDPGF